MTDLKYTPAFEVSKNILSEYMSGIHSIKQFQELETSGKLEEAFNTYYASPLIKEYEEAQDYTYHYLKCVFNCTALHLVDLDRIKTSAFKIATEAINAKGHLIDPTNFIPYKDTVYPALWVEEYLDRLKSLENKVMLYADTNIMLLCFMVAMHYIDEIDENGESSNN